MTKHLLIYLLLSVSFLTANSQDVQFSMSAPNAVEVGQQFRLSFSLNAKGENLQLPNLSNFEILMGPSTGKSISSQMINGKFSKSVEFSYTYILRAKNEGKFTIDPATVKVDGDKITSNSITIQVVPASQQNQQGSQQQPNVAPNTNGTQSANISKENLFVRVHLSKSNLFKGDQIIATVKLYADPNIPISGFEDVSLPTYEGFYAQDIELPKQISFTREVYNDKIYQVGVLKKTVLFPQQVGKIRIEPFSLTLLVQQRLKARSFFDDFFNSVRTVKAKVTSLPVSVNVKDLPTAPANFYGGVGDFNITSSLSNENVSTNDAVTLKVTISGTGNIRLINTPKLDLPADFEVYDPKTSESVRATGGGVSGSKTIEYLFQPRFAGDYTIPSIKFSYFNPKTGSFETKATESYEVHVEKGENEQAGNVVSARRKQDIQFIGKDIRFIIQDFPKLKKKGYTFFGSTTYYLILLVAFLLFLGVIFYFQYKKKSNKDVVTVRNRKANKVALKRLKIASQHLKTNNNEEFYRSILQAFWGYFRDKFDIPIANLNREVAIEKLKEREINETTINDFNDVVNSCEFAQFAPSSGFEARNELYQKAVNTMSKIEKELKK